MEGLVDSCIGVAVLVRISLRLDRLAGEPIGNLNRFICTVLNQVAQRRDSRLQFRVIHPDANMLDFHYMFLHIISRIYEVR